MSLVSDFPYKADCRYFRGDVPCLPHKREGVHCIDCQYYDPTDANILIIKLGAVGDVIRTTPILSRLRKEYPRAKLWWLSHTPEVVPSSVDVRLAFNLANVLTLRSTKFSLLLNLDKDREACALAVQIEAEKKKGFTLAGGIPAPIDDDAREKFVTGIFDDANLRNKKSYPEELFEICGWKFSGERYELDVEQYPWNLPKDKPLLGLNTGCGGRWTSRLWAEERWIELAKNVVKRGWRPLLLGGEAEHERNTRIAALSGALYPGYFPLKKFISLVDQCAMVVTGVTMGMHIPIALGKKIVLFNNIFNPHEFELYGLGEIVMPEKKCICFFRPECVNTEYHCMESLTVAQLTGACERVMKS